MTEPEARKKYGDANIKIYKSEFVAMYFAMLEKKGPTSYKLICEGPNGNTLDDPALMGRTDCGDAYYWDWKR